LLRAAATDALFVFLSPRAATGRQTEHQSPPRAAIGCVCKAERSPVFLYGCAKEDLQKASPHFAAELYRLQHELRALANPGEDEHEVLVFRLFHAPPPSVRSRRRRLGID